MTFSPRETASPSRAPLARATYVLGFATRQAVDLFKLVFGVVSTKAHARRNGSGRRSRISTGLSKMQSRLQNIEQSIMYSSRKHPPSVAPSADVTTMEETQSFIEAMSNSDPGVRRFALGTVGGRADKVVQHIVLESLHDPDASVRCSAAEAAARASISQAVFSLIILLADPSDDVVRAAQKAIQEITGRRINIDPGESEASRARKIEKLKVWWKENRFTNLARGLGEEV